MKKIQLTIALALSTLAAQAESRSAEQALTLAQNFVSQTPALVSLRHAQFALAPAAAVGANMVGNKAQVKGVLSEKTPAYYLCNVGDAACVIVSGDDRFIDILGYTTNGSITEDRMMPEGVRYWLDFLEKEMNAAIELGYDTKLPSTTTTPTINASVSVAPLLTTTWSQRSPYNNKLQGNVTGCVATGTAQVMNYWKYPTTGTGAHTSAGAPNFAADFAKTTYAWSNMLDFYGTGWESPQQIDAVATLMLHVGVACDMSWDKEASSTPNNNAAYALTTYFKYNKNIYIESRDCMSLGAWKALIIDQLQAGRPVCYSGAGYNPDGTRYGHFFVCDGYDAENGMFNFNWGWGGYCDGYYAMTALEPGTGGTGAGNGTYNADQTIFVNVQPTTIGQYITHFDSEIIEFKATNKSSVTVITNNLSNNNTHSVEGSFGIAVYNNDGTLYRYFACSGFSLPYPNFVIGSNFRGSVSYSVNLNDVPNGEYVVCGACYDKQENKVFPIRAFYGTPTYYKMTVSGNSVAFSPKSGTASLTGEKFELTSSTQNKVYKNQVAAFKLTVRNSSAIDFNDEVGITFEQSRSAKGAITVPAYIPAGETREILVSGSLPASVTAGQALTAKAVWGNNGSYTTLYLSQNISVQENATGIHSVQAPSAEGAARFSLAGQRVGQNQRGIIIKNGKKYMKK